MFSRVPPPLPPPPPVVIVAEPPPCSSIYLSIYLSLFTLLVSSSQHSKKKEEQEESDRQSSLSSLQALQVWLNSNEWPVSGNGQVDSSSVFHLPLSLSLSPIFSAHKESFFPSSFHQMSARKLLTFSIRVSSPGSNRGGRGGVIFGSHVHR